MRHWWCGPLLMGNPGSMSTLLWLLPCAQPSRRQSRTPPYSTDGRPYTCVSVAMMGGSSLTWKPVFASARAHTCQLWLITICNMLTHAHASQAIVCILDLNKPRTWRQDALAFWPYSIMSWTCTLSRLLAHTLSLTAPRRQKFIPTQLCHLAQPIPRLALAAVVVIPTLLLARALLALEPLVQL